MISVSFVYYRRSFIETNRIYQQLHSVLKRKQELSFKVSPKIQVQNRNIHQYPALYTVSKMDTEISHYAQTYKNIASIPTALFAKILQGAHENLTYIHSLWSSQDFVKFEKNVFSHDFLVEKESLKIVSNGISCDTSSELLCAFSKSGKKRAILREKKSSEEKVFLEIWNEYQKETTFDMNECKEHGKISRNDPFKCFEWSSDEKFLLYAAEEKQPKSVSYFKNSNKKEETDSIIKGEEYAFKEEWGEACVGDHHTVLCMLEIETGKVEVLPTSKIGEHISFGQAKWGPDDESIIFVGWKEFPYRLGVWACRNRRSTIYAMNLRNKDIEILTPDCNICVRSPRFSPNFDTLIYLENSGGGPHFKGAKLRKYDWKTKKNSTIVDLVKNAAEEEFPGIYADYLPLRCWSEDGKNIFFSTIWRSRTAIVCVDIDNGHVQKIDVDEDFGSAFLLDVQQNMIIAEMSAPNIEPCLAIGHFNYQNKVVVDWKFLDANSPVRHNDINWEILKLIPTIPNKDYSNLDYDIIVISPKEMQSKCPLIIMPHGGPHSCFTAGFLSRRIGFVKLGYVLCIVNYRGSIGFGENNLNSLPGNIGSKDVADQAAIHVKNNCNFDIGNVVVFGGSHGGFLGAHLCGQYPDFYKAAVLLNPVIDVSNMMGISDIPDWTWVEGGCGDNFEMSTVATPDNLKTMWERSPIKYLENVRSPTLLLLGTKDLRVPMSQGLKYYQLLKARGVPVRVCKYDDNHQLLKTPHDGDHFMQSVIWFNKYSAS
ncbi:acylamino-acid-releasing enzyme [Caerostris darwini]|uniref:Acylamino-acid-releasing enzyme n=1 Tax=Caerostris darwini TaxID=1538125 RepID=A0AAV4V6C4_9ARAC|nr:acylamino-acid-releasing enzyme [Caerostris darwini]